MNQNQINNPLHGITLEKVVRSLVEYYGWEALAKEIDITALKVIHLLNPH